MCGGCTLPEALLKSIWQRPRRPLGVSPSPSRIWLFCRALCSSPHSTEELFHSLVTLGRTVPVQTSSPKVRETFNGEQSESFYDHKLTLHVQSVELVLGVVSLETAECVCCSDK